MKANKEITLYLAFIWCIGFYLPEDSTKAAGEGHAGTESGNVFASDKSSLSGVVSSSSLLLTLLVAATGEEPLAQLGVLGHLAHVVCCHQLLDVGQLCPLSSFTGRCRLKDGLHYPGGEKNSFVKIIASTF